MKIYLMWGGEKQEKHVLVFQPLPIEKLEFILFFVQEKMIVGDN